MSLDEISGRTFNQLFAAKLSTPEGIKEAEAVGAAYIRDIIREEGFLRRIIPPERVTEADCQRSTTHDTLTKIVDIEPDSVAAIIPFKGEPRINYIQGRRVAIPFYMVASERFKKTEQELRAYEYPVKKIIERNTVRDIQEAEDGRFMATVDATITTTGLTVATAPTIVDKTRITSTFKLLDNNRRRAEVILMTDPVFDDFMANDNTEFGDQLLGEVTRDGYKYNTILGRRLITTNKHDMIRQPAAGQSTIYAFTSPEFLGKYYVLNDIQFYVDKRANLIEWQAWIDEGAAIVNTFSTSRATVLNA